MGTPPRVKVGCGSTNSAAPAARAALMVPPGVPDYFTRHRTVVLHKGDHYLAPAHKR